MRQEIQRWEYLALTTASELRTEHLNRYGEDGWELVSTVPVGIGTTYYVFKRPRSEVARSTPITAAIPPAPGSRES